MLWKSLILIAGLTVGKVLWDNVRFAHTYFPAEIEVVDSLASKAWHFSRRGCTFAVVRFSEANKQQLILDGLKALTSRERKNPQPKWRLAQNWSATPTTPIGKDDAFESCRELIPKSLASEIGVILARPGSWSYRSWREVTIISPEHRLAAAFRFGD